MDSDAKRTGWLEAAKQLMANPLASVLCPSCQSAQLQIIVVPSPTQQVDRHLICQACGAREVVSQRPQSPKQS